MDPYKNIADADAQAEIWKKAMKRGVVDFQVAKRCYEYYKNLADFLRKQNDQPVDPQLTP